MSGLYISDSWGHASFANRLCAVARMNPEDSQREVLLHTSYGPPEKEPASEQDTAAKGREPESNEGRRGSGVGGTF